MQCLYVCGRYGRRIGCTSTEFLYVEHDHGIHPNECTFYLHCLSSYADNIKIWMDDDDHVCFALLLANSFIQKFRWQTELCKQ